MGSKTAEKSSRSAHWPLRDPSFRSHCLPSISTRALNRIELQVDLNYEVAAPGADFVFNVHAAHTPSQRLSAERLVLKPALESQTHADPATGNRYLRVHAAPGTLALSYAVTVDLMHRRSDPAQLERCPSNAFRPRCWGTCTPAVIASRTAC